MDPAYNLNAARIYGVIILSSLGLALTELSLIHFFNAVGLLRILLAQKLHCLNVLTGHAKEICNAKQLPRYAIIKLALLNSCNYGNRVSSGGKLLQTV